MQNAIAFANNDVITVAWSYGKMLAGCMGFALYRIDQAGNETPLPAMAVFKGMKRKKGQTCEDAPIQKFYWKDPYARLIADKTGKRKFRYKIVPMAGKPGKLEAMSIPHVISNEVEITAQVADNVWAYFNRGLISTQHVSAAFKGKPAKGPLLKRIADQNDSLRKSLSGDMVGALLNFVARAKSGGRIFAGLYELHDQQLLNSLEGLKGKLSIVLSNSVKTDANTKKKFDDNQDARDSLEQCGATKYDRIMPNNHIGHNKFLVHVDSAKKARAVLFGSTNWTSTGLCAQTNNTVVVEDPQLAQRYLDYWNKLAADTKSAAGDAKKLQAPPLRTFDGKGKVIALDASGEFTSWFSPNTPKQRGSNPAKEKRPPDMAELVELIDGAKQAVLFLAFYPGAPSIADWAAAAQKANKNLFVRGCVTNVSAAESFYYDLQGATPPKKVKGQKSPPAKQDYRVLAATALDDKAPKGWTKEILSAGFAIIHDKIVVIDPFSDNCIVVTGSHNLGHKASYNNDENLVIVRGNKKLAHAYASHVLDVYDHFAWRYLVKQKKLQGAEQSLNDKPEGWQGKYFDNSGAVISAQLKFWLSALA